ncbi:hypothetical protein SDC9_17820 [bioreactor metagenome]|uniref:DUF998 domain-containing protein n=1 Tax=bioreactor metagenome TaxID=1076179 RepID=A0A644TYR7_9ZZZZ|nr:DUF998 domain-containing protein [Methanobrevibacter sp.]MEA4956461.1 DUF998 domain-containing protein [Methanobrevibacter sp.]
MTNKNIKGKNLGNINYKWFISFGAIAACIFTLSWIIQEIFKDSYNPLSMSISSLAVGSLGWIQSITFILTGLLLILFAYGIFNLNKIECQTISKWSYYILIICGISLIGAGFFTTGYINGYSEFNMSTNQLLNSILNQIFLTIFFFGIPIACFIFGNYFTYKRNLVWLIYSFLSGIIILIIFFVTNLGFSNFMGVENYAGLLEKITFTISFFWVFMISLYFLRQR